MDASAPFWVVSYLNDTADRTLWVYCPGDEAGCPGTPRAARRVSARRAPALRHRLHPAPRALARVVVLRRGRARPRRAGRGCVVAGCRASSSSRMTDALRLLALWLTPALWLAMPALILARGSEGLWVGLALTVAPLIALVAPGGAEPARSDAGARFRGAVLLAVAGISIWANVGLAADVAAWQGAPRWQGIVVAVIAGWVFAWRGGTRWLGVLWLAGLVGMSATLFELAREAGVGPLAAWERVASQPAFRFQTASSWVTTGQALGGAGARVPMVFAEEHRVTAPFGGRLRGRSVDGGRVTEREWTLAPGQSVTLRAGDRLEEGTALPLRFEPGKRVPGAPTSGPAWSGWPRADGWPRLGLCLTLVVGGVGLLRGGMARPMSRRGALVVGAGLVAAFALAQGWAIYGVLGAPDVFLGGVIMERLADLQTLSHGPPRVTAGLQTLLLIAGLASF